MSEVTLQLDDALANKLQAYLHNTDADEITEPMLRDFLDAKSEQIAAPTKAIAEKSNIQPKEKTEAETTEFMRLLEATKGTWKHGDGLDYQLNIRSEWDNRP